MKKTNKLIILLLLIISTSIYSKEKLVHYGIATLDNKLSSILSTRLNANGKPIFIIQNIKNGVSQGDIIRFKDKAILITPDIWQTLKSIGALQKLKGKNVITFKAKSKSYYWNKRKNIVTGKNSKKGYLLGAEILKIFEDYFKISPKSDEIVLKFDNRHMSLIASKDFLNQLRFNRVKKITPSGKPQIISPKPYNTNLLVGDSIFWQIWAIDTKAPGSKIRYNITSNLPDSITWNSNEHYISGKFLNPGKYNFKFVAISASKLTDTINFTITVNRDKLPIIADIKDSIYISGETFKTKIISSDYDHPNKYIKLSIVDSLKGMILDSNNNIIWKTPKVNKKTYFSFSIKATDPKNISFTKKFIITVIPQKLKKDIKKIVFNLPLDTIKQHKIYSWKNSMWIRKDITVESVKGDNKCYYKKLNDDGLLVIQPDSSGIFNLKFHFIVDGKDIYQDKKIFVKKNRTPIFKSILNTYKFRKDEDIYYAPIAIDPDNDSITIRAFYNNNFISSKNIIKLNSSSNGDYIYKFEATDMYGNKTEQYIGYKIVDEEKGFSGLEITKIYNNSWNLDYRTNKIRFGLFTPDLNKAINAPDLSSFDIPFVFIGINLVSSKLAKSGNTFFLDGGINLRAKSKKMTTGGIMIRTQGRYKNVLGTPWVFEHTFQIYAKQALLLVDTTGLENSVVNDFGQYIQDSWQNIDMNNPIGVITDYYPPLKDVLDEYSDHGNSLILLKMATWYPIGKGFWFGPTMWMADQVTGDFFENCVGIGLYHDYKNSLIAYRQSFRIGLNGSSTPSILWDFSLFFGK